MKLIFHLLVGLILPMGCNAAQAPKETIKLADFDLQSIYNIQDVNDPDIKGLLSCTIKNPDGALASAVENKKFWGMFTSSASRKSEFFNDQDAQELRSYLEMRLRLEKK